MEQQRVQNKLIAKQNPFINNQIKFFSEMKKKIWKKKKIYSRLFLLLYFIFRISLLKINISAVVDAVSVLDFSEVAPDAAVTVVNSGVVASVLATTVAVVVLLRPLRGLLALK